MIDFKTIPPNTCIYCESEGEWNELCDKWNQAVSLGRLISGKAMNAPDMQHETVGTHAIASTSLVMMLLSALNTSLDFAANHDETIQ